MSTLEIRFKDLIFDKNVQQFCNNSRYKCPNYNHSWGCPPEAPYLEDKVSEYSHYLLVYAKTDITENKHNNAQIKREFENEMESAKEQVLQKSDDVLLLWGGHCDLCYTRLGKKCTYDSEEPCRFPIEIRYSMEAVGINVDATVKKIGIDLQWPPKDYIYRFGLICYNLPS